MNANIIFLSMTSATFELVNEDIYYSKENFNVYLNDKLVLENINTNVFSVYDLIPNTSYKLRIGNDESTFNTLEESVCLNVKDFYALGDGVHDDTLAIQCAIMSCPLNGRVLIPEGIYNVTTLFLKSDIALEIAKDAVLLGNTDRTKYPVLPGRVKTSNNDEYYLGTWEGEPDDSFASTITGINVSNVLVYGQGIIDENAQNSDWWINHRVKRIARRPKGIFLNRCKNIGFQGITVKNTPSWNQHPFFSEDLKYVDMFLTSPKNSPTTDGCDPESCKNVEIIGVKFSVGDDCIAIKSGKIEMGKKFRKPSENIIVRNCLMEFGHGGVTLGSEMSGGIKDIKVSRCIFNHTDRGLRIKSQRGRGNTAIIDDIIFDNIIMDGVLCPLVVNMMYKAGTDIPDEYRWNSKKMPVDDTTPYLGKFTFKNIKATGIEWGAGLFHGLPEMPIEKVTIINSSFRYKEDAQKGVIAMTLNPVESLKQGMKFINVKEYTLDNVFIDGQIGEKVIVENEEM